MSRYYFAARYSRHPEMRTYRDRLVASIPDAVVTSRWIDCHDGELEASYTPEHLNANPEECWKHGRADLEDVTTSDVLVSFTGRGGGGKGGRHIEHGYHLAAVDLPLDVLRPSRHRIVVVGPRENIFHCHPRTEVFPDFNAFLNHELDKETR